MRSIESDGDTIDEAIENALRALEVGRDRVEIEILSDATKGIFGFGGKKARIRATVRAPLSSRLADDVPDVESATIVSPETSPRDTEQRTRPRASGDHRASRTSDPVRSRERTRPADPRPPSPPRGEAVPVTGELQARCLDITSELLSLIGVPCQVTVQPGAEVGELRVDVTGDSGGLLIGRRGQTLDSLEYMLNRILAHGENGGGPRVVLDIEGYRERRRQYLEALAHRLADKARQTGKVVTLNPMSPRDRRIVHITLHDDQTVTPRSQGEGYFRRMIIMPAERSPRGGRPPR